MGSTRMYESNTSGLNCDRFVDRFDDSTLTKMQAQYWTAKQLIRKKLGKKEDKYLLASDAEFDIKVNLFRALQTTSEQMLICIDDYQHYLGELTQTEVSLGQMLNSKSRDEVGDTSKALAAVGKVQSLSASYRQKIRAPLIRFMEELRVFSDRAILDCLSTVEAAEKAQTEYRGSLLWMKKTSIELDPEAENALEKFRKAQGIVRRNKEKLDGLKMDTLQKVDLLAASRCNLLAQLLENYQKCLYDFYEQTALAYAKIQDLVNKCKKYKFEILKDLAEPTENDDVASEENDAYAGTSLSLINMEGNERPSEPITVEDDTAAAEIIDETTKPQLGIVLGREESPLGELDSDSVTEETDQPPLIPIGPLPEKYTTNEQIPKISPPPGWKVPQKDNQFPQDLVDLLAHNDSAANAESFASEWTKLFTPAQPEKVTDPTSNGATNLPSHLLDTQETRRSHFPNPFEEPMFTDWNKYLNELDSAGNSSGKQC